MSNKLKYNIEQQYNKLKLKEYLRIILHLSGRLIKGAGKEGRITVNGKRVDLRYILKTGDCVELDVEKDESQDIAPQKMDLDIVYEDADVIVVNKQPFMVVHPTKNHVYGTLANGLLYYFHEKGENCIVRLVSRLDMNTSGLILIAKNQFSHMALARDMNKDDFEKSYLAVVHGNLQEKEATVDKPIYRVSEDSFKREVDERGQESITHYEVKKSYRLGDLVKLTLETGRTHQIRVHMEYLGHPLYGDSLYGVPGDDEFIKRQALHAYRLCFPHPRDGRLIELEVDLPEDIKELIKKMN